MNERVLQAFQKVANHALDQGMTKEAFDSLSNLLFELTRASSGIRSAYVAEADLSSRIKRVQYPHGYRYEFRDNGRYEGVD